VLTLAAAAAAALYELTKPTGCFSRWGDIEYFFVVQLRRQSVDYESHMVLRTTLLHGSHHHGRVHSAGLHRLGCHPEWHAKLRRTLGAPVKDDPTRWRPHALQPITWQTPGFMLKLAIACFLAGLTILIWDAAERSGLRWSSDDTKVNRILHRVKGELLIGSYVAFMFTIAAGISLILYASLCLGFSSKQWSCLLNPTWDETWGCGFLVKKKG
jgi:hypothetical protein